MGITLGAAEYLAESGVRTVGVDYLSVAAFGDDAAGIHRALLSAGVWIIEGLDLSPVAEGSYELNLPPSSHSGQRRRAGEGAPATDRS